MIQVQAENKLERKILLSADSITDFDTRGWKMNSVTRSRVRKMFQSRTTSGGDLSLRFHSPYYGLSSVDPGFSWYIDKPKKIVGIGCCIFQGKNYLKIRRWALK